MAMSDKEKSRKAKERRTAQKYEAHMRKARLPLTAKDDPPPTQIAEYDAALRKAGKIK